LKSEGQIIALLQEDMNTLKKECMKDNMPENMVLTNIHKYEEGTFSYVNSKSWTKANVAFQKMISPNLWPC
jgi:hypothetical protein